ncbi:MAG: translation initiation factor eIF-1A [Acidilobus sp.]
MVQKKGEASKGEMPLPSDEEGTMLCVTEKLLGGNFVEVVCSDGNKYRAMIPGKMRRRVWIHEGDLVLFLPWGTADMKGELVHRYEESEARELIRKGLVPKELLELMGSEGGT